jgi:hypothetical protein
VRPSEHELRRRVASLAEREARLGRRQREIAAREAELACDESDVQLGRLLFGARAAGRRERVMHAAARIVPTLLGVWLLAYPLLFGRTPDGVAVAAVACGAALAFAGLAGSHPPFRDRRAAWALGAAGTWLFAWADLGSAGTTGRAPAATGALVWLVALTGAAARSG